MITALRAAGVRVGVLVAPVIPMITDQRLEHPRSRALSVHMPPATMLRLPHELKDIWREWLRLLQSAEHVMAWSADARRQE
jgi:DNA repair photolyase